MAMEQSNSKILSTRVSIRLVSGKKSILLDWESGRQIRMCDSH